MTRLTPTPRTTSRTTPLRRLAPLVLAAALTLTGCSAVAEAGTNGPDAEDPLPAPGAVDRDKPAQGPAQAKPGTWYRFDLFTHCGISTLKFSGRYWRLIQIRTDLDSNVKGPRVDWTADYTPGYVQLESDKVAVFETAGQPPLAFEPGTGPGLLCK
ncbi:hypothetical protein [Streptomyces sp. NPDC086023]|uniref:hypothetical protein n=1 Tax=Streptomyces sp. NPDC086023 TaxID=3365746 RepID=UPI0037D33324